MSCRRIGDLRPVGVEVGWLLFFLVLVILLRLPAVGVPFDNDSGAIAYHARLITRGEPLYGSHHTGHHLPGAYYAFAAAFRLLGDRVESVNVVLMGWITATMYLIHRLGAVLDGRATGVMGAMLAGVLISSVHVFGMRARIETLSVLPQTAAVLALVLATRGNPRPRSFFWVGLFSGATLLLKANHVAPLLLATAVVVTIWHQDRSRFEDAGAVAFRRLAWGVTGGVAAIMPVVLYFASQGLLGRLWRVFDLGLGYARATRAPQGSSVLDFVLVPAAVLGSANPIVALLALAALFVLLLRARAGPRGNAATGPMLLVGGWFALGLLETAASRTFYAHYYLVLVPSVALLATWFVRRFASEWGRASGREWHSAVLVIVALGSCIGWSTKSQWSYFRAFYTDHLLLGRPYEEVMTLTLPERSMIAAVTVRDLADYVREHTDPGDLIFYWSGLVELYYVADRRASTENIWPHYVDGTGMHDQVFRATHVIVGSYGFGYDGIPGWLKRGLDTRYEMEAELHGQRVFRRRAE